MPSMEHNHAYIPHDHGYVFTRRYLLHREGEGERSDKMNNSLRKTDEKMYIIKANQTKKEKKRKLKWKLNILSK